MKTKILLPVILTLFAVQARAQTIANFDLPSCSGNGVRVYQGIDFSPSPWDCEKSSTLPNDATETISWYAEITSGKFKFITPSILTSLRAGGSDGPGSITISTDAGEIITAALPKGVTPLPTGFTKPASVVTVSYSGGWTIELDDLAYTTPAPATLLRAKFLFDDGMAVAGSVELFQIPPGAPGISLGIFPLDANGFVSAKLALDPASQYHGQLRGPSGAILQDLWTVEVSLALAAAAITALPKLELDFVLLKATGAIKSVQPFPMP